MPPCSRSNMHPHPILLLPENPRTACVGLSLLVRFCRFRIRTWVNTRAAREGPGCVERNPVRLLEDPYLAWMPTSQWPSLAPLRLNLRAQPWQPQRPVAKERTRLSLTC
eukprot:Rmarinus@m.1935